MRLDRNFLRLVLTLSVQSLFLPYLVVFCLCEGRSPEAISIKAWLPGFMIIGGPTIFRGNTGEVTPVPIPNTEVKLSRADGTMWGTAWESRTPRN